MSDIEALRALSEAATEGEWISRFAVDAHQCEVWSPSEASHIAITGTDEDAAFIAAAVNYVRALLAAAPAPTGETHTEPVSGHCQPGVPCFPFGCNGPESCNCRCHAVPECTCPTCAAPAPTEAGDPHRPGALLDELDACDVILDGEGE